MAYNGTKQIVIDTATKKVKRHGYTDMGGDGAFDGGSETVITQEYVFNEDINKKEYTWNGSTFIEGSDVDPVEQISVIQQIDINKDIKSTTYKKMGRAIYMGKKKMGDIKTIEVVSHMDSDATSYDIKVIDRKNGSVVVAEVTGLTNTESDINDLGTISNLSENKTILEVQIRHSGGGNKRVYIDSLILKF